MEQGRDAPEPPTPGPNPPSTWRAGWGEALRTGTISFLLVGVVAEALAFVAAVAARGTTFRPGLTAAVGGVLFFAFHHVAVAFSADGGVLFEVSAALMAGTLLVAVCLFRSGRRVAQKVPEGSAPWTAALAGAMPAVPYTILSALAWTLVRLSVVLPANPLVSSSLSIRPSLVQAVLWPLLLGVLFGAAGGIVGTGPGRLARPAVAGALSMALAGLALAFVGLLVVAAARPGATGAYFEAVARAGAARGFALIVFTLLVVPNLATWVFVPAMGSCLQLATATGSACALSYGRVPTGAGPLVGAQASGSPSRSAVYLLFLVVPAVAALAGGRRAATTAAASSRADGAMAGALAGVGFGAVSVLLVLLATVSVGVVSLGAGSAHATFALGPEPLRTILLALAWGVAGGAVGGALRSPSSLEDAGQEPKPADDGPEAGPL